MHAFAFDRYDPLTGETYSNCTQNGLSGTQWKFIIVQLGIHTDTLAFEHTQIQIQAILILTARPI